MLEQHHLQIRYVPAPPKTQSIVEVGDTSRPISLQLFTLAAKQLLILIETDS